MKALGKVNIHWSPDFAYVIGLLVTDGNLSSDGRHINLTSKDYEQIQLCKKLLGITNVIGRKGSGSTKEKKYFSLQFGDVIFYRFLISIGIGPRKSKTIAKVKIPDKYFFDFLRGHHDGDGTFYSYWDKRWRSSFMFYLVFISASKLHIAWLRAEIHKRLAISGHITKNKSQSCYQLKYAKAEAEKLLRKMYYRPQLSSLNRKHLKIQQALAIIGRRIF
jgi:hypothetical protein